MHGSTAATRRHPWELRREASASFVKVCGRRTTAAGGSCVALYKKKHGILEPSNDSGGRKRSTARSPEGVTLLSPLQDLLKGVLQKYC